MQVNSDLFGQISSEFSEKVVMVTGGNSGIGQAIAKEFNRLGAKVVIFGRNEETLQSTLSELNDGLSIKGDVRHVDDLDRAFKAAYEKYGKISVLVAAAGCGATRHVEAVDEEFYDEVMDTNLKGVYFTVQRSLEYLDVTASIILISSIAGHFTWPEHSIYSAAKAGVCSLARGFASDLISRGIRVNAISPGFTDTPIFDKVKKERENFMEERAKTIPNKRFASSEEIANAAIFLSSAAGNYIVGHDVVIDGGMSNIFPRV